MNILQVVLHAHVFFDRVRELLLAHELIPVPLELLRAAHDVVLLPLHLRLRGVHRRLERLRVHVFELFARALEVVRAHVLKLIRRAGGHRAGAAHARRHPLQLRL